MTVEPTLRATAFHEAGHAVMRYWLGLTRGGRYSFTSVSIEPDGDTLGRLVHDGVGEFNPDLGDDGPRVVRNVENLIVVCLAGVLAEEKAMGPGYKADEDTWAHDRCVAFDLAIRLYPEGVCDAYLDFAQALAESILSSFVWGAVEALAACLLEHGTLTYRRAKPIIRSGLGLPEGGLLRLEPD